MTHSVISTRVRLLNRFDIKHYGHITCNNVLKVYIKQEHFVQSAELQHNL